MDRNRQAREVGRRPQRSKEPTRITLDHHQQEDQDHDEADHYQREGQDRDEAAEFGHRWKEYVGLTPTMREPGRNLPRREKLRWIDTNDEGRQKTFDGSTPTNEEHASDEDEKRKRVERAVRFVPIT